MQKSLLQWRLSVLLLFVVCSFSKFSANAQLSYSFTQSTGTYNSISGTSVFGALADNDISGLLDIGFSFTYGCNVYTQFKVSSNGFISLGNSTLKNMSSNLLSITGNGPILAPLWDDLMITANNLAYTTSGSSGNKILTVQWNSARWDKNAGNSVISFQVKLYENGNAIEFIYNQNGTNVSNGSASIGISGGYVATDFYSLSNVGGTTAVSTYGTETNNLNTRPVNGKTFKFTPNNMSFTSATTTQITTNLSKCNNLQQAIVGVQVVTAGCKSAISATEFQFNLTGTTANSDVTGIHIYYTADNSGYSPVNEFNASAITVPTGTGTVTVTGSRTLVAGINYFWIAYDVNSAATTGNDLDAQCTQIKVGGSNRTLTITDPTGVRDIVNCAAAPGGVTNASFWIKGNQFATSTANGAKVSAWNDNSGSSRHATNATTANQPTYRDNATQNINFYPVVEFDDASQDAATADFMDINNGGILSADNNAYEVYAVIVPGVNNLSMPGKFLFAGDVNPNCFNSFDVRSNHAINDSWNMNDLILNNQWSDDTPLMLTFDYNYANREMFIAGGSVGTLTGPRRSSPIFNSAIGYQRSSGVEYYDGSIAEIITYANTSHTSTQRYKVESYLALKYGITLTHNYTSSNGTVIWNMATNTSYNKNIIGIVQDNAMSLTQRQAKSISANKDILTVYIGTTKQANQGNNTATFTAGDRSYFMVGTNYDSPVSTYPLSTEKPAGVCCRIMREWLVQPANFSNTDIKLEFDFNSVTAGYMTLNSADLRLLADDDGNFSNATIVVPSAVTAAAGVATLTVPASTFTSKRYFTLASVSINTLLPLDLKSFSGSCNNNAVQLKWATAQPAIGSITIERSTDRVSFVTAGVSSSNASGNYSWTDESPLPGTLYYRLKTTADNGSVLYSSAVTVVGCNKTHINLSTNPATGQSILTLQLPQNETAEINLYDVMGRRFEAPGLTGKRNLSKGFYNMPVHVPGNTAGIYFLSVNVNGDKQVYRILKP
jgi:hypothetical protein